MVRPPKSRPWTKEEEAYKQLIELAGQIHNIPETSFLSRLLISALLARIGRRSPKEVQFLKGRIALLAGAERRVPALSAEQLAEYASNPPDYALAFEGIYRDLLAGIVTSKVPRTDHYRLTLSDQRKRLTEYFIENPVEPSLTASEYSTWLKTHAKPVYQALSSFPCLCEYRPSLDGITDADLEDCKGPAYLIVVVLAELHRSTPSAVQKILKQSVKQ